MQKLSEELFRLAEDVKAAEQIAEDYRKAELAGELEEADGREEGDEEYWHQEVCPKFRLVIISLHRVQVMASVWGVPQHWKLPRGKETSDQELRDRAEELSDRFINNYRLLLE